MILPIGSGFLWGTLGDLWGIFGELWGSFGGKPLGSLGEFVILKKEPQGTDLLALLAII